MPDDTSESQSPLLRPTLVGALALLCIGTFVASLFAVFANHDRDALAFAVVALSGVSTALALTALYLVSRKRDRSLEPFVTICAWTRRVPWEGRWISFEEYLGKQFNVRCTHGICEEAAHRMREVGVKSDRAAQRPAL